MSDNHLLTTRRNVSHATPPPQALNAHCSKRPVCRRPRHPGPARAKSFALSGARQNSAAGGFPRALGASQAEPLDVRALSAKMRTRPPFASMWVRISEFRALRVLSKMPAQSFVQTAPSIFPTEKGNEWQACVQGLSLHRARCLQTEHCNDTLVCSRRSATLTRHPALPAAHDGEHRNMQRLLRQQCVVSTLFYCMTSFPVSPSHCRILGLHGMAHYLQNGAKHLAGHTYDPRFYTSRLSPPCDSPN